MTVVAELDPNEPATVLLDAAWNEFALLKTIPGVRWRSQRADRPGAWTAHRNWATYRLLTHVVPDVQLGPNFQAWALRDWTQRVKPCLDLRDLIEWPTDWRDPGFDPRLRPYQRIGVYMGLIASADDVGGFAWGDEMAGGKGVQALCTWRMLYQLDQEPLPGLVVCPNNAKRHWAREVEKWFPDATPYVVPSGQVARRKVIQEAEQDPTAIIIVNYEAMRLVSRLAPYGDTALTKCIECAGGRGDAKITAARCETHPKLLNFVPLRHVVLDEVHHIKDPRAKQTRACWYVCAQTTVKRRWGTTGTMLAQHIGDTWSIMHALAPDEYPTRSKWMELVALQAYNAHGGLDVVGLRPDTSAMFFNVIDPRYRRVTLALVAPQCPPAIRIVRPVELPKAQRTAYDDMQRDLAALTPSGEVLVAANNLVASTRLLQAAAGTLEVEKDHEGYDPDDPSTWRVRIVEPSAKLDELERIVEDLDIRPDRVTTPIVVLGVFVDLLNMAAERLRKLGLKVMMATGAQSEWERDQAKLALDRRDVHVVVASIAANTEAVDWSSIDTMIFLGCSWSMIQQTQVEARNSPARRADDDPRRHQAARLIYVTATGTREERQVERLQQRAQMLEELNRDRDALVRAGRDTSAVDDQFKRIMSSTLDVDLDGDEVPL